MPTKKRNQGRYKEYYVARLQENRDRVSKIKESSPCHDCGVSYPAVVMDFDHREGETKVAHVSQLVNRFVVFQKILDEIAKCDLVCANCHRIRTRDRRLAGMV